MTSKIVIRLYLLANFSCLIIIFFKIIAINSSIRSGIADYVSSDFIYQECSDIAVIISVDLFLFVLFLFIFPLLKTRVKADSYDLLDKG